MHIPALHPVRVKRGPARRALIALGLIAILAGIGLLAVPLLGVWQRGQADQTALS